MEVHTEFSNSTILTKIERSELSIKIKLQNIMYNNRVELSKIEGEYHAGKCKM